MIGSSKLPLEDELGDILEKAMRRAGLGVDELADRAELPYVRMRDAVDYRSDLNGVELRRIAGILGLNEIGLCAIGSERYPMPEIGPLPFALWPLRMPHGIGVANAYLVGELGSMRAILFDTGAGIDALASVWPTAVRQLDAVFLTHVEGEHAGGLCDVVARFGVREAFIPLGATAACGRAISEKQVHRFGDIEVTAFATPGHAAAHNCYLVRSAAHRTGGDLLVSGDLLFAGSVGGAYFSHAQLQANLRRMLELVPPKTVIAPGHGPLTTAENELRYNPFVV